MTVFNIHKNKAICVLPWVHEHIDLGENKKPCCHGKPLISGRTIADIRTEMLQDIQPPECKKCYEVEIKNESSARIRETIDWIKKFGEPNINNPVVESIDLRNDPTCNLKCKTCGPYASTLWAKEKGVSSTIPYIDLENYDKTKLRKIYLAGGEPTYNRSYLKFLKELLIVNPTCEVLINTNLKRLPSEWKNIICSFKNLTVIVSCDAIEDLGCYVRYPLDWGTFEKNVEFVKDNSNFMMFNLVPSNLTVHSIDETVLWMSRYSNNISISIVGGDIWEHKAVPMKHRQRYIDSLGKIKKFKVSNWCAHKYRLNIESLIEKYSSNDYDRNVHVRLQKEIAEQDSHRTTQLKEVDPFLYSWILS